MKNKYIILTEFIEQIKIDAKNSKLLYLITLQNEYLNEYLYNKDLFKEIKNCLNSKSELNLIITYLHKFKNLNQVDKYYKKSIRTLYRKASKQFEKFKEQIFNKEEELYNRYILKEEIEI